MRRCRIFLISSLVILAGSTSRAADTIAYTVQFSPSGDATLDALLRQTSSLTALQQKLPATPFALIGRAEADKAQFLIVLHSLGYYFGRVGITILGFAPNDPDLLDALNRAPAGQRVTVQITPQPGPLFLLGKVDITNLPPGFTPPALVKPGQPARAGPILAATPALTTALHNAGYAFATVSPPLAVAELATQRLDVTYNVVPGARKTVGPIRFSGLQRTDADFLRRHIPLQPGQPYSDKALAAARASLLSLGLFTGVSPQLEHPAAPGGPVPILFRTTMQKRHAVTLSGAYATDSGGTISTSWEDRNLFTRAETLTLTATATGLGGTGTTGPGYNLKSVFTKPDFYARGQVLALSLGAVKRSLTAYSRKAVLAGATLTRPLTPQIGLAYGPTFTSEQVQQEGTDRTYVLLQLPVTLTYDTADSLLEPTRGINASFSVTPTQPVMGHARTFVILQGGAATYVSLEPHARGILALRGQVASIQGTTQFEVPPDQRFYAGGSSTVRGYTYQTIGPLFPDDNPEGGLALDAASVEFRQRVGKSFGIVPFVDAGQVSAGSRPFNGKVRVGAGLGGRYYTSIGPIRLDLAFPLTRIAKSNAFAIYIGLGEAF